MKHEDIARARESVCIFCDHLSIWHVEYEHRICPKSSTNPARVLDGKVKDCPSFKLRSRSLPEFLKPKPKEPVDPINKEWK